MNYKPLMKLLKESGGLEMIEQCPSFHATRLDRNKELHDLDIMLLDKFWLPTNRYIAMVGQDGDSEVSGRSSDSIEDAIHNIPWDKLDRKQPTI